MSLHSNKRKNDEGGKQHISINKTINYEEDDQKNTLSNSQITNLFGLDSCAEKNQFEQQSSKNNNSCCDKIDQTNKESYGTNICKILNKNLTKSKSDRKPSNGHIYLLYYPLTYDSDIKNVETWTPYPKKYSNVRPSYKHVVMPYSDDSLLPNGQIKWSLVEEQLLDLLDSVDPLNQDDIINAIKTYNPTMKFDGLKIYFEELSKEEKNEFFNTTLRRMINLVLQTKSICTRPLPILDKNSFHSLTISQYQAACLLANGFFCTFLGYNTQDFNFYGLYDHLNKSIRGKLDCLRNYFNRITIKMLPLLGIITFHLQHLEIFPVWKDSEHFFTNLYIDTKGKIEENGEGMLQLDFANKRIGGGVLRNGCVQEEIRFMICPELIISRLITSELSDKESLLIRGIKQFNSYEGYGNSFVWAGDFIDKHELDSYNQIPTEVLAIDALNLGKNELDQLKPKYILRETNKAFCGFYSFNQNNTPIATGNWGCGVFKGNIYLKALIQLMAAAVAERDVCYFTYGNEVLARKLDSFHQFLKKREVTVGTLWKALIHYCETVSTIMQLGDMYENLKDIIDQ